jgi:hypothetical protein
MAPMTLKLLLTSTQYALDRVNARGRRERSSKVR